MKKEQQRERSSIYNNYIKRTIDVLLSGMALLILWPLLLIIAVIIKITDPGPVLFTQKRVGSKKNGELTYFSIYKYRTMKTSTPKDVPTHLMENPEKWITGIGSRLSTKEQKNLKRNGNAAFCGVIFLPVYRFCPYYGYQHV